MRTADGWVTAPWTHLPMVSAPFADFTWRHARRLAAQAGRDDTNETEIARVLDELLTRAQAGPLDLASAKVVARTRVGAATHRPPREDPIDKATDGDPNHSETGKTGSGNDSHPLAAVIPLGVFDADAEAERWP